MARRPKIGDLYEVETVKGFAYFQYCHRDPAENGMGPLIRVIEGLFQHQVDPEDLVVGQTLFWIYFPMGAALYHKLIRFVANLPIPVDARRYPALRGTLGTDKGIVLNWAIVERDEKLKQVVHTTRLLNPDEERLSLSSIATFPTLVDWIEEQWRPESDPLTLRSQRHWRKAQKRKPQDI